MYDIGKKKFNTCEKNLPVNIDSVLLMALN